MNPLLIVAPILTGAATYLTVPLVLRLTDKIHEPLQQDLESKLNGLGLDSSHIGDYLRAWRLAMAMILVGSAFFGMLPIGLLLGFVVYQAVPFWLRSRVRTHQTLLETQIPSATRQLSGQLRAGTSLPEAIEEVSLRLPNPLRWHFTKLRQRMAQGAELRVALEDMRGNINLEGMTLLVVVLKVALERGGPLADVLERITRSLQEMERVRRKRDADTAAGRMMIIVLALFPVGFLVMMTMFNLEVAVVVFTTFPGQVMLLITAAITYFSLLWANKILKGIE